MAGPTHLLGQSMGRYLIQSVIGSGGFATVYRAVDTTLERPVALKVVDPAAHRSPTIGRRFVLEGRAVASLNHPAIVPVYDAGENDGVMWLAMRLIEGSSLDHALASGRRLTAAESLAVVNRIGAALDHAHASGVVHRDVKPSNILLEGNDPQHAWLADFGIAATARTVGLYTTGALGTAAYMAPEQSKPSEVGPPADVYSLACVAYEMLTGQRPFPGDDYVALLLAHATEPIPSTGQEPLDELMARAMAKQPGDRPGSGSELAGELRRVVEAAPPSALPPESPIPLRRAAAGSVPTVVDDDHPSEADTVLDGPLSSPSAPATLVHPGIPAGPPAPPAQPASPVPQPSVPGPPGAPPGGRHLPPPPPPGHHPPSGGPLAPPRDPTVVRTSRRSARRLLSIGGLILLAGAAVVAITVLDPFGGGDDTQPVEDTAGVAYRVPTSWLGDDSNPPDVLWSEGDIVVLRITHFSSGESDAVDALQDAEPALCSELASPIDVPGSDAAARCDNADVAPATTIAVLKDGELWLIRLEASLSVGVRNDFVNSLDFDPDPG